MTADTFVYVFGNPEGPYKIGVSSHPAERVKHVAKIEPGRTHCSRALAKLQHIAGPVNRTSAIAAERAVHAALSPTRVDLRHINCRGQWNNRQEWFTAPLSTIREVVERELARREQEPTGSKR